MKYVPLVLIDNMSAVCQIMAFHLTGNRQLLDPGALSYYSYLTLSQAFQPMAVQLSKKAVHPFAKILATASCCSSKTGPRIGSNDDPVHWCISASIRFNELTHWGWDKMAAFSQTTLSNAFSWMKIIEFRIKFHWSLFLRVFLTILQHWFW